MWQSVASSMWTVIESNLGIIVACMPALRRAITMLFPMLLEKMGRSTMHSSTRHPNRPPTHASAALSLERPMKNAYSKKQYSSPDDLWLQQHNPDNTATDTNDSEETDNVSDGYRGSDDHIFMDKQDYVHRQGVNQITKTTEVRVGPASQHGARDPKYSCI